MSVNVLNLKKVTNLYLTLSIDLPNIWHLVLLIEKPVMHR